MNQIIQNPQLQDLQEKIKQGVRLTFEDGLRLFESNDLPFLGALANRVRERLNGRKVYYSVNLHINHTNVCTAHCVFCAFARRPGEEGGYVIDIHGINSKILEALERHRINEVHIVGGLNPELGLDYYVDLFSQIRRNHPRLFIKALTAVEIDDLAERSGLGWRDLLIQLKEAG